MLHQDYIDALRTLGLDVSATEEEIRKTYRNLIKRLHPDSSSLADKDLFLRIQRAYECCRARFEQSQCRIACEKQEKHGISSNYSTGLTSSEPCDSLQNGTYLFLSVSARDALLGASKEMWVVDREEFCPRCNGTGAAAGGEDEARCPRCHGKGCIPMQWGEETLLIVCSTCSGTGFTGRRPCTLCKGRGRVSIKRPLRIHLPRGIQNGTIIKLPGQGPWQANRYSRAPVFVEVRVEFPEGWHINGLDLHTQLDIPIWTALKGGQIPFQTLDERWIQIPVSSGVNLMQEPIVVEGHGWINELGKRGNLILTPRLLLPQTPPSQAATALLQLLEAVWPISHRPALPP